MSDIDFHLRVGYGYLLGGPFDNWIGLRNEIITVGEEGYSFPLPGTSWVRKLGNDEENALHYENHPDYFQEEAQKILDASSLDTVRIEVIGLHEWESHWQYVLIAESKGEEYSNDPVVITTHDFVRASEHDVNLHSAVRALDLMIADDVKPGWVCGIFDA